MIVKAMNEMLSPVRIVVEESHVTIRTHGASSKVNPLLEDMIKKMKASEIQVPPGVYRIEATQVGLLRGFEYDLRPM